MTNSRSLMFLLLALIGLFTSVEARAGDVGTVPTTARYQPEESIVRVDFDKSYRCAGLVVSPHGHVLVSKGCIAPQTTATTVGTERTPARFVAWLNPDLALYKAVRPVGAPARMLSERPKLNDAVRVEGFTTIYGQPAILQRAAVIGTVSNASFSAETTAAEDIDNALLVKVPKLRSLTGGGDAGASVFDVQGNLVGIIIGKLSAGPQDESLLLPSAQLYELVRKATAPAPTPAKR